MELTSQEGFTLGSLGANIISTALLALFGALHFFFRRNRTYNYYYVKIKDNYYYRYIFKSILATVLLSIFFHFKWTLSGQEIHFSDVIAWVLLVIALYESWRYASIGIHSAEKSVLRGTSYKDALDLCRSSLWFLGTGGAKLTSCSNFEETIQRCSRAKGSVRFLFASPDSNIFEKAARNADVSPDSYRHAVTKSLKILKKLKEERQFDFEVRFYLDKDKGDKQDFRIMIADQMYALVSYNVYGTSDSGRLQPQLILHNRALGSAEDTFYFPFEQLFMRVWESSQVWDFKKYAE